MVIELHETENADKEALIELRIGELTEYLIPIKSLPSFMSQKELSWHYDFYPRNPVVDKVDHIQARHILREYGERLWKSLFEGKNAAREIEEHILSGNQSVKLDIVGSSKIHGIPWEIIWSPRLEQPLATCAYIERRSNLAFCDNLIPKCKKRLRILLVCARPQGKFDAPLLSIAKPLLEHMDTNNVTADIHIVFPGTFMALQEHLQLATAKHGPGYYHVLHLDLHGLIASSAELFVRYGIRSDRELSKFLVFETADYKEHLIEAHQITSIILQHGIQTVIMNSCNSAMRSDDSYASIAEEIHAASGASVVAMAQAVTVTAATMIVHALYGALLGGESLNEAVKRARTILWKYQDRVAFKGHIIKLEDWALPVLFNAKKENDDSVELSCGDKQTEQSLPTLPREQELIGRDWDVLSILRQLLDASALRIKGMLGCGKTSLLAFLIGWWKLIQPHTDVAYIMLDKLDPHHGVLDTLASKIGLSVDENQHKSVRVDIRRILSSSCWIVVLDELQALNKIADREMQQCLEEQICYLISSIEASNSKLVLATDGSLRGYKRLNDLLKKMPTHHLERMDLESAIKLSESLLKGKAIEPLEKNRLIKKIVRRAHCYPLAIKVLTDEHLMHKIEDDVLDRVYYACSLLNKTTWAALMLLAPFECGLSLNILPTYLEKINQENELMQHEIIALGIEQLNENPTAIYNDAACQGLIELEKTHSYLRINPVITLFLRGNAAKQLSPFHLRSLHEIYVELYNDLGHKITSLLRARSSTDLEEGIECIRREEENLLHCFQTGVSTERPLAGIFCALERYYREQKDLDEWLHIQRTIGTVRPSFKDELTLDEFSLREWLLVVGCIAEGALAHRRFSSARDHYILACKLASKLNDIAAEAVLNHQLGHVMADWIADAPIRNAKRYRAARWFFKKSIAIKRALNDNQGIVYSLSKWGELAGIMKDFSLSRSLLEEAYEIAFSANSDLAIARILHLLGNLEAMQESYEKALRYYQQALTVKKSCKASQSSIAIELDSIARARRRLGEFEEVEQHFLNAQRLFLSEQDIVHQAESLSSLASEYWRRHEWDRGQRLYLRAIKLFLKSGYRTDAVQTLVRLIQMSKQAKKVPEIKAELTEILGWEPSEIDSFIDSVDTPSDPHTKTSNGGTA